MATWQLIVLSALLPFAVLGLLILRVPRTTRRGLFFNVYVGADWVPDERARAIERSWKRGILVTTAVTIVLGAVIALAPGADLSIRARQGLLLIAVAVCLVVLFGGVIICNARAMRAAQAFASPPGPPPAAAFLTRRGSIGVFPPLALIICIAVGLLCVGYGWAQYDRLPERFVMKNSLTGEPDRWMRRSFGTVIIPPLLAICLPGWLAAWACLLQGAKRVVRLGDQQGVSARAQDRFRRAQARFLAGLALLVNAGLVACWLRLIDIGLGRAPIPSVVLGAYVWVLVGYILGGLVYIGTRIGAGGAKLEQAVAGAPLTDGLADNTKFKLGEYFNPDDPAMFVEDRFGPWYSPNWGNRKAVAFFVVPPLLMLAMIVAFLVAAFAE
jgi:uncharacterized membrane protein